MPKNQALLCALDLATSPGLAVAVRQQPLRDGVLELIQITAGNAETLDRLAREHARDPRAIRAAAEHYIHQILFYPGADCFRILGVRPNATRHEMRVHVRWLMMWLHPDFAGDEWRAALVGRVLEAWRAARIAENSATVQKATFSRPPVPFVSNTSALALRWPSGRQMRHLKRNNLIVDKRRHKRAVVLALLTAGMAWAAAAWLEFNPFGGVTQVLTSHAESIFDSLLYR